MDVFMQNCLANGDIAILDQHLQYGPDSSVLGTDLVAQLLARRFRGLICVRSANDSPEDLTLYRDAGAHCAFSKDLPLRAMVAEMLAAYRRLAPAPRREEAAPPTLTPTDGERSDTGSARTDHEGTKWCVCVCVCVWPPRRTRSDTGSARTDHEGTKWCVCVCVWSPEQPIRQLLGACQRAPTTTQPLSATSTRFAHSSQCHTVATSRCAPLGCDDMRTGRGTATAVGNWIPHCHQTAPQGFGAGTRTSSTFTPPKSGPVTMTAPPGSLCVCERVVTPVSREGRHVSSAAFLNNSYTHWLDRAGQGNGSSVISTALHCDNMTPLRCHSVAERTLPTFLLMAR